MTATWLSGVGVAILALVSGCNSSGTQASATPVSPTPVTTAIVSEGGRYVTVGFWNDPACGGSPVSTHRFPVDYGDAQCHSWPGRSGENSASRFSCGADSFSYTQWTTLTCSGGQNPPGTRKTSTLTTCTQDFPPTLYARIVDFSGCTETPRPPD